MEKKKILIVSRSFYPMNSPRAFRTTELLKEFARQGHDVTLITTKNEEVHSEFERKYGVTIKDLGQLKFPPVNLNGSTKSWRLIKRAVRRGLLQFFEYPDIELIWKVKKALKKESSYDLLISIAVPHPVHWGVSLARSRENPIAGTWAADCGDPYMGLTLDSFRKLFYFKHIEKYFCRKADYITVPFEGAREGYYPEFHEKIKIIPQGFNFREVEIDQDMYQPNPVPTFAYAGGLVPGGRDPKKFLSYLVQQNRDYHFILYTKSRGLVEPWLSKGKGKIEIRDYIPRKELLKVLSQMDFLVNFDNETPLQMPSKLIDYYLTGRPVLSVGSREVNPDLIDQFLEGNFENQFQYENINQYRIGTVCNNFLMLCNGRQS